MKTGIVRDCVCWDKVCWDKENIFLKMIPCWNIKHTDSCEKCLEKTCDFSKYMLYMEWWTLKHKTAQETPVKGKRKSNTKGENSRMQRKKLRLEGKAYITEKRIQKNAVKDMTFVTCKCRHKCAVKFPEDARQAVYDSYWKVGSYDQCCQYIAGRMIAGVKKQVIIKENSRRTKTFQYFLDKKEGDTDNVVRVCRVGFENSPPGQQEIYSMCR